MNNFCFFTAATAATVAVIVIVVVSAAFAFRDFVVYAHAFAVLHSSE